MRRTVRPFVKEFKNRSSKSSTRPATPVTEEPKPSFFDLAEAAPRHNGHSHDDGYEAALKAADAIFGKKINVAAPIIRPALADGPQPVVPVGRVLPSLIETPDAAAADRREPVKKPRKPRAPRAEAEKAETPATPARRGRPPRQPKSEAPSLTVERPVVVAKVAAEPASASAPRRTRRSIQLRWVLQTELKAGEKWKRRLPEAAR